MAVEAPQRVRAAFEALGEGSWTLFEEYVAGEVGDIRQLRGFESQELRDVLRDYCHSSDLNPSAMQRGVLLRELSEWAQTMLSDPAPPAADAGQPRRRRPLQDAQSGGPPRRPGRRAPPPQQSSPLRMLITFIVFAVLWHLLREYGWIGGWWTFRGKTDQEVNEQIMAEHPGARDLRM
eukprot:TRINITY_DN51862_c0_g1_i1.p2 TRINITY_DN51862_c0_g1~~TRINITY_DN51862_c0_g1_i1.p2  ORF type:complete len:203 (+),score=65.37 TRINITY_DN51862_c0_g1_i1:77-610(+)